MIDQIRSTVKNSLIYGLGNISVKLVGFVLIPLYTGHFTTAEYGVLGVVEITIQLLVALFGMSLFSAFFRWYWDKPYIPHQRSIFFTILVFVFAISTLLILTLWPFTPVLAKFVLGEAQYTYLFRLLLITSALEALGVIPLTLMRLQNRALLYSASNLIRFSVNLILTVYFVAVLGKKVEGVYEAHIIGHLFFFAFVSFYVIRNARFQFQWKILREMLVFSMPLVATMVSSLVINITDRYTLRFLTDFSEVGIYNLGFKVANSIKVFVVSSIMLAVTPVIFQKINDSDNKRFYSKILTYAIFAVIPVILFVALFGKEAIKLLSRNTDYWDAFRMVPFLSFAILFGMMRDIAMTGLHITRKTGLIAGIVVGMMVFHIVLTVIMVYFFRSTGAAVAILITQVFYFVLIMRAAQRHYRIPYEFGKILKMIVLAVVLLGAALLSQNSALWIRLVVKSLCIVAFPVILYFLGFYEQIELQRIREVWNKWKHPHHWPGHFRKMKKQD
ncbi:MAG: lipopolysaccharide biosynthesis protein [Bacteroidales bacterium]